MSVTTSPKTEMLGFAAFLEEVHGRDAPNWQGPYPWQERFADRCSTSDSAPPAWVVAPTGAGKTTVVDALIWSLAKQADVPPAERTASTRIVWAIDRRILVDEVYAHAQAIADRLDAALETPEAPLHGMAVRLLALAAPGENPTDMDLETRRQRNLQPLAVTRWRGGIPRDPTLLSPTQPQVVTSTVGQIGSRLLFRGYGVGEGSLALNAGLFSCDTTICLDEAHLATPFQETVAAIQERRDRERARIPLPALRLITLTATPPGDVDPTETVRLTAADHERLGPRWHGPKTVSLREPDGKAERQLATITTELIDDGHAVVACIANRVLTARRAHGLVAKTLGDRAYVRLLIGPQRPADRNRQLDADVRAILFSGARPERPLVVIATQTIEVGLDADFDAMVTQSASVSALTQRLGRLNRAGTKRGIGVVVRDPGFPLYERDEEAAWDWLHSLPGAPTDIDASVRALSAAPNRPARSEPGTAATLTDAIVRQLAQTSSRPGPFADPDIVSLLAGIDERPTTDVGLVWRRDLRLDDHREDANSGYLDALLTLARPHPDEVLTLSLTVAKKLIAARASVGRPSASTFDDADLEGGFQDGQAVPGKPTANVGFAVCRGSTVLHGTTGDSAQDEETISLGDLRPGDVIVLPTAFGGCDDSGFDPASEKPTTDVGRDLFPPSGTRDGETKPPPIRLSRETFSAHAGDGVEDRPSARPAWWDTAVRLERVQRKLEDEASSGKQRRLGGEELIEALGGHGADAPGPLGPAIAWIEGSPGWDWDLRRTSAQATDDSDPLADLVDTDPDEDLDRARVMEATDKPPLRGALESAAWVLLPRVAAVPVHEPSTATTPLSAHSHAVRDRLLTFLAPLSLAPAEAQALHLAALAHDLGKADPRFQAVLTEGAAAPGSELLAKSAFGTHDPQRDRLARSRAGLPRGFRHEASSVAALASAFLTGDIPPHLGEADRELTLHLTGTHHGHGRPFWALPRQEGTPSAPFLVDVAGVRGTAAGDASDGWLGGAWLQQFNDLLDRYGPWTLAYLEALLVLADRTVSREGN